MFSVNKLTLIGGLIAGWTFPLLAAEPGHRIRILRPPVPPADVEAVPPPFNVPLPPPTGDGVLPRRFWLADRVPAGAFIPAELSWIDAGGEAAPDAGWLGLQLSPLPAALAAHLDLDGVGLMVNNIFEQGPADEAGLLQYDVIVEVDAEKVSPDVKAFAEHIRGRKAGNEVTLQIIRKGEKQSVTVKLGEMPQGMFEHKLKFEEDPDLSRQRSIGIRGRILRPGPEGWILDDLDALPDIEHLERWIERRGDDHEGGTEMQEVHRVTKDGEAIHVRREKDGKIVVKRYPQDAGPQAESKAEAKTYESMDKLREADAEAYDLLQSSQRKHSFDIGVKDYHEAVRQYMEKLLKEYRRTSPPSVPQPPTPPRIGPQRELLDRLLRTPKGDVERLEIDRRIETNGTESEARFEVHPDGSITAEVQEDGTQLKMTYGSEEELKTESPRLYDRYKAIRDKVR